MVLALAHFTGWSRTEIMDMDTEDFVNDFLEATKLANGK